MSGIAGVLLVVAGGYLAYFWARLHFGDTATVADDPIVSFAIRFSGHIRTFADARGSTLVATAAVIVFVAVIAALLRRRRRASATLLVVVTAIALLAAGCGGSTHAKHAIAGPRRTLTNVHDVSQLRSAFNSASREPRLIVIVSPT
jgi:apolipoprotein N-acyltransferase